MSRVAVRVRAERCETCIFRPGNLMHLNAGRVADMLDECERRGSHITCHETIEATTGKPDGVFEPDQFGAVCRGFFDRHRDLSPLVQVAERLNALDFVGALNKGEA